MCRGGLERGGATGVTNMRGTNQAARKAIEGLAEISGADRLRIGDVVLKTRDADDPDYPLPDKYRKGGSEYTGHETNYTHIGTVTGVNPLEITHMTSPTAKKDTKIGNWKYSGRLPWVDYGEEPEQEQDGPLTATVTAASGSTVKMRAKPSSTCRLYWNVPIGAAVAVDDLGKSWSRIRWAGETGYMMTKFLRVDDPATLLTVIVPGLTETQASDLLALYPDAYITRG
jgi:hypothetical protein